MSTTTFSSKITMPFYPLLLCSLPKQPVEQKLLKNKQAGVKFYIPRLAFLNKT